jgi:hypothetical protein
MKRGIAIASFLLLAGAAYARTSSDIVVPEDEARIVKFDKPVSTIFVANPVVADVNMIDSTHAFILGKAFGATNLIAMDSSGSPIVSRHITVFGSSHLITLNRGAGQFTFACASSRCETASTPGDVKTYHDDNMEEVERREDMGVKQAATGDAH